MSNSAYVFLPFVRKGFGATLQNATTVDRDNLGLGTHAHTAANRHTEVKLNYTAIAEVPAGAPAIAPTQYTKDLVLYDSGYVTGIMADAIVKTTPLNEVRNFECNYLAAIDFYDEDLPWRYTPLRSAIGSIINNLFQTSTNVRQSKLRPWISLIVLKRNEFSYKSSNKLPAISISGSLWSVALPPPLQTWAWAHVQYLTSALSAVTATQFNSDVNANGDVAISRLLCPRRLEPATNYVAFVVPTFEIGRRAGLGIDNSTTNKQAPAWSNINNASETLELPFYHTWEFTTAGRFEDFESILRKIVPKVLPEGDNAKRIVKIDNTGHPVLNNSFTQAVDHLDSVKDMYGLLSPASTTASQFNLWAIPAANANSGLDTYTRNLAKLLNESNTTVITATTTGPDPVIGPPFYGNYHMRMNSVPLKSDNWLGSVNLDPTLRMMAGLGAEVVRQNQEFLMDIAWNQIGQVEAMNQVIAQLQLAQLAMQRIYERTVASASTGTSQGAALYLAPVNRSILANPGQTIAGQINGTVTPNNAFSPFTRKLARPNGPIGRKVATSNFLPAVSSGTISIAPQYVPPTGVMRLSTSANNHFSSGFTSGIAPVSNFTPTQPGTIIYTSQSGAFNTMGASYSGALGQTGTMVQNFSAPPAPNPPLNWNDFMANVVPLVNPTATMLGMAQRMFAMGQQNNTLQRLDLVMAAPRIPFSIAQGVANLGLEYLMPGIGKIENNGAYMLSPNQQIIEALMLGANYEMNRELLWRGYPTDQRGTPLRHFWGTAGITQLAGRPKVDDDPNYMDIRNIHQWGAAGAPSELGKNSSRPLAMQNMTVVALRSELFKKYPNTNIYMQKAMWQNGKRVANTAAANTKRAIFYCPIPPDFVFVGFDISPTEAKGNNTNNSANPGWFLTFEERVGEPVFGADEERDMGQSLRGWDHLSWLDLLSSTNPNFISTQTTISLSNLASAEDRAVIWGSNAADLAYATYQKPSCIFIHSNDMIS